MLVLEGVDRCGKTTVARNLLARDGSFSYRHFTCPTKIAPGYRYLAWQLADAHPAMILDRFHLSDWSYGHVFRTGPEMSYHEWRLCELMLHTHNALQVVMTDEPEAILSRWGAEEMYEGSGASVAALVERYREQTTEGGCPRVTTLPTATLTLPEIERPRDLDEFYRECYYAPGRLTSRRIWRPASRVLGSPFAKFLVLGSNPPLDPPEKDERGSDPDLPFCRAYMGTLLWEALDTCNVRWWEGSYAWAQSFTTPVRFGEFVGQRAAAHTGLRHVLCLGDVARDLYKAARNNGQFHNVTWNYLDGGSFLHRGDLVQAIDKHLSPYCDGEK